MEQDESMTKDEFSEIDRELEKLEKMFKKQKDPLEACEYFIISLASRMSDECYFPIGILTSVLIKAAKIREEALYILNEENTREEF